MPMPIKYYCTSCKEVVDEGGVGVKLCQGETFLYHSPSGGECGGKVYRVERETEEEIERELVARLL